MRTSNNLRFVKNHRMNVSRIYKWDRVFKNGPAKIYGRQPQILVGTFLNTLSQIISKLSFSYQNRVKLICI